METTLILIAALTTNLVFAQNNSIFEDGLDSAQPNESISFNEPEFLGLRLLGRTGRDRYGDDNQALLKQAEKYCNLLNYKGVLVVTEEFLNTDNFKHILDVVNGSLLGVTPQSVSFNLGGNGWLRPSLIKILRCKK